MQNIASEPFEDKQLWADLGNKRRILEEGAEAFQAAAVGG